MSIILRPEKFKLIFQMSYNLQIISISHTWEDFPCYSSQCGHSKSMSILNVFLLTDNILQLFIISNPFVSLHSFPPDESSKGVWLRAILRQSK
uniref:Uncharacterized protein n=1 Tax=Lepeophtheirus salmonis TaxID=72036 RepID=A0A0K2UZA0_LEPSM